MRAEAVSGMYRFVSLDACWLVRVPRWVRRHWTLYVAIYVSLPKSWGRQGPCYDVRRWGASSWLSASIAAGLIANFQRRGIVLVVCHVIWRGSSVTIRR